MRVNDPRERKTTFFFQNFRFFFLLRFRENTYADMISTLERAAAVQQSVINHFRVYRLSRMLGVCGPLYGKLNGQR